MRQTAKFDYYYGMQAEAYSFYRIPKVLFTSPYFKDLSCEAKVLYGLMLDRMALSIKNRWFDEEGRVYIIFSIDDVKEYMGCCQQKAVKLIRELDKEKGIGLIEKKRLGFGKINTIYVKNFILQDEPENSQELCTKKTKSFDGENNEESDNCSCFDKAVSSESINFGEVVPERAALSKKYENQISGDFDNVEVPEEILYSDRESSESGMCSGEKGLENTVDPQKYENQTSRSMKNELLEVQKSNFKNIAIRLSR